MMTPNHAFNRTRRYGPSTWRSSVAAGRLPWFVSHLDMIAFQVDIDGERYITAGVEDWSLLNAFIVASFAENGSRVRDGYIEFSSGGLSLPNMEGVRHHFRWPSVPLSVGSRVLITVVETKAVDPPKKRYRSDATTHESPFTNEEWREMEYKDYLALKAKFEKADG